MDKDKLIKYALIAVGVYLAYKWLASSGMLASLGIGSGGFEQIPASGPGTGTTTQPAPGTTTGTTNTIAPGEPSPGSQVVPSDSVIMDAALHKAAAGTTGSFTQSGWDWNYYRGEAAKAAGVFVKEQHMPDLTQAEGSTPITAAQYHALLASKNIDLSGLGWGGHGFAVGRGVQ